MIFLDFVPGPGFIYWSSSQQQIEKKKNDGKKREERRRKGQDHSSLNHSSACAQATRLMNWCSGRSRMVDRSVHGTLMDADKAKVIVLSTIISLLILLLVFWSTLGLTRPFFILAGLCFAFLLLLALWMLTQYSALDYRRRVSILRRHNAEGLQLRQEYSFLRKVAGLPTKFRYEALAQATRNFQTVLGWGTSATVYKGTLDDGTAVAVKCIDPSAERGERDFRSEVSAIASTQHVNLVRLLGYCVEPPGERYLVYDFFPNGSLNQWIFPKKAHTTRRPTATATTQCRVIGGSDGGGRAETTSVRCGEDEGDDVGSTWASHERCLPWGYRYRIAIDVAKALSYLHHDCRHRILHLDVKPENILLDENFRARVADFGLSKLMNREDQRRVMSTVRGTKGYLAPEWLLGRGVTEKSDVYSYGMVLLELVGGRRNVMPVGDGGRPRWSYLPRVVAEKVREKKEMDVVDKRLTALMQRLDLGPVEKEVKALLYVGLWCLQEQPGRRPTMRHVVEMLEGTTPILTPPETEMVVADLLEIHGTSRSDAVIDWEKRHPPMSVSSFTDPSLPAR